MMKSFMKRKLSVATLMLAVFAMIAGSLAAATADPIQFNDNNLRAMGSDTTQSVMNGLSGYEENVFYEPLNAGTDDPSVLMSFDAIGSECVVSRINGAAVFRPNGSGNGRRALSRAFDGADWGISSSCGGKTMTGLIQLARSSSGPNLGINDPNGLLKFIPFGRDGLSFGYYRNCGDGTGGTCGGVPTVTDLTPAEITAIWTDGPQIIDNVLIVPCGIQTGSGTYEAWLDDTGVTAGVDDTATAQCNALLPEGRAQEHDGDDLKDRGVAAASAAFTWVGNATPTVDPNVQVVIGMSASQYIAQRNGASPDRMPNDAGQGVFLGSIDLDSNAATPSVSPICDGGGCPGDQTLTDGSLVANGAFYGDSVFGRSVYNVFLDSQINSGLFNVEMRAMFKNEGGNTARLCTAPWTTTIETFGFQVDPDCGDITGSRALQSGQG